MRLIAKRKFSYNKVVLHPGDSFEANNSHSFLVFIGFAEHAQKRKYKRRDMSAEDDILNKAIEG